MTYDAVVVGAGVSGLNAARFAARGGAKVLVVDRVKEIGRFPPRSTEGMPDRSFWVNQIPISPDGQGYIASTIRHVRMTTPSGKAVEMSMKKRLGYVVHLERLERWLADDAAHHGAEFRLGESVAGLTSRGVRLGSGEEIDAPIVVGADGVNGQVGKWSGLDRPLGPGDWDAAGQWLIEHPDIRPNFIEINWLHRLSPMGYTWVFDKGVSPGNGGTRRAWVGLGVGGTTGANLRANVDALVEEKFPGAKKVHWSGGRIALAEPLEEVATVGPVGAPSVLLVGEAGRGVLSHTGAGLAPGLHMGNLAGAAIAASLQGPRSMAAVRYNETYRRDILPLLRHCYRLKGKILGGNYLERVYPVVKAVTLLHRVFPSLVESTAFRNIRYA